MKRNCNNPECKKEYEAKDADVKRGWGLCCSKSCAAKVREIKKPGYNPQRVAINNIRRDNWNINAPNIVGGSGKISGYTSEGYRIMDGVAYDEFDDPVYDVDPYDDTHPFDMGDAGDKGEW